MSGQEASGAGAPAGRMNAPAIAHDVFIRRAVEECVNAGAGGRPICPDCDGTGVLQVGGHCTHGLHRGDNRPCTAACVWSEGCPACFGTGIQERKTER